MRQTTWKEILLMLGPVIIIPIILFYVLHTSPSLSIRTKLVFTGHPVSALTSKISLQAKNNKGYQPYLHDHHAKAYQISRPPSPELNDFIVYQKGFFFYAKYLEYDIVNIKNV